MHDTHQNWAGNLAYSSREVQAPISVDEVASLVVAHDRVRALGSRHSFNDIADTGGVQISLASLAGEPVLDAATVRVPAGWRYGDLAPWLHARGAALANLASLPHISIAGSIATGTHGSGERIGTLATQVAALELVDGRGEVRRIARGDVDFAGAVVGLGALGIVTEVELDVVQTYELAQTVHEGARWDAVLADVDAVQAAGDSVSLFTTWRDAAVIDQVWVKSRGAAPDLERFGAVAADGPRHPLPGIDPAPCTAQLGEVGPWFERLPHFRLSHTPSAGAELQSEYLIDRADLAAAIAALQSLAARIAPLLLVCEVRTMAVDELWLSPAYGRSTVGLHFTWRLDEPSVRALLPDIEAALPASARPHWGKIFEMPGDVVRARFPRWGDFAALRDRCDPDRRFGNAYLERLGLV